MDRVPRDGDGEGPARELPGHLDRPNGDTALTRVAIITDIHGNLLALQESLAAIDQIGVDAIYCGGDLVGYGPHPNEVCELIEQRAIPTIYGNYDYAIGRELDDCGCAYVTAHDRELGQRSVAWTLEHTDQAAKQFMHGLPFDLRFELGCGRSIWCTARRARSTSTCSRTSRPACTNVWRKPRPPTCSCSGTPTSRGSPTFGGVLFVNCGSVGKPKDGDPRAGFAILELDDAGEITASIERVPYDAEAVAARSPGGRPARRIRREAGRRRLARRCQMKYVLFVCTHNAGRSQMAQAFFERDCATDCRAESAGSEPAREVWPEVVEVMREIGIDLSGANPSACRSRCSCTPTGR